MTPDELRLLSIHRILDGIGGIDLHDRACQLNGGDEPQDKHYVMATREALDVIVKEEFNIEIPQPRFHSHHAAPERQDK